MPPPSTTKALVIPPETRLSTAVLQDRIVKILEDSSRNLSTAVTIPQHKLIADIAAAQEIFSIRQRLSEDVIVQAHTLKIVALAKLGELLEQTPKATGGDRTGRRSTLGGTRAVPPNSPLTLAEMGIDKKTSSLSRKLSALSDTDLAAVAERQKTLAQVQRETTASARAVRLSLPDAQYRIIYADPPWKYRDKADTGGVQSEGAAMKYPTMSIPELCDLNVKALCDTDAVLFLWVTSPLLFECQPVIKAWGFSYRASFVWDKVKHNHGHYNSVRHEFLLICVRGSGVPDVPTQHDSVQVIERAGHSEKPTRFRELIDELYPTGKRIELFARTPPPTPWEAWGNEL
jgi:N6-adenosine-specific RNA methylase IME4